MLLLLTAVTLASCSTGIKNEFRNICSIENESDFSNKNNIPNIKDALLESYVVDASTSQAMQATQLYDSNFIITNKMDFIEIQYSDELSFRYTTYISRNYDSKHKFFKIERRKTEECKSANLIYEFNNPRKNKCATVSMSSVQQSNNKLTHIYRISNSMEFPRITSNTLLINNMTVYSKAKYFRHGVHDLLQINEPIIDCKEI